MDKKYVMVCNGVEKVKNIGDHIQSLAASQFSQPIDGYVEREKLDSYDFESKAKVILNGWFMHSPEHWPPSNSIKPLVISYHLVPNIADKVLSPKGIEFFKKNAPIGCRDTNTVNLLKKHDIPCYFSGCLTLTLGKTFFNDHKGTKLIFVDPFYEYLKDKNGKFSLGVFFKSAFYGIINLSKIKRLWKKFQYVGCFSNENIIAKTIRRYLNISSFYKTYSTLFEDSLLFNADYYTHTIKNTTKDEEALNQAKQYLKYYSEAKLVVTSRIHCALPCLGMETPVLFVTSDNLESTDKPIRSAGRFGGLTELMHVIRYNNFSLNFSSDYLISKIKNKITSDTTIQNKNDYKKISDKLSEQCINFMND